mgnify:CR=1 FL=1
MVGVAEMLTFAFGFWVRTGVGVTLDFLLQRNVWQEFCNSHQKKFDGINPADRHNKIAIRSSRGFRCRFLSDIISLLCVSEMIKQ